MILAVAIIVLVLSVFWNILDDFDHCIPFITMFISSVAVVIMFVVLAANYIGIDAMVQENKMRYEMLKYQYENNFYDNENEVGKYQLVSDIRAWNEDLIKNKALQHDRWIGVFVPDVYDQFDYIDIGK